MKTLFDDWVRAPISGTMALLLLGASAWLHWHGLHERAEHAVIMAMIVILGRPKP